MMRRWRPRMRERARATKRRGGGAAARAPAERRERRPTPIPEAPKTFGFLDLDMCLERVHSEDSHVALRDLVGPIVGTIFLAATWSYYVILMPPRPRFIESLLGMRFD